MPPPAKKLGLSNQTFYRWRKEYGGLKVKRSQKRRDLQKENAQLRRAVADLPVEKLCGAPSSSISGSIAFHEASRPQGACQCPSLV